MLETALHTAGLAFVAAPFGVVPLVFDYLYHRGKPRRMFADRLLEATVGAARRAWHAPKAPYVRPIVQLVRLALWRPHQTYRIAWTARNTLRTYYTRVTRRSSRAAVRALRRQDWVRAAGRFMLLEVTIVADDPTVLEASPIPATVDAPKPKKAKAAPKRKAAPRKRATRRATTKRKARR